MLTALFLVLNTTTKNGTAQVIRMDSQEKTFLFFGRIVAIADVFDAMVSGRAYSGFMDQSAAVQRIVEEKELFDPEILKACVRAHDSGAMTLKTSTASNSPEVAEKKAEHLPIDIEDPKPSRIRARKK